MSSALVNSSLIKEYLITAQITDVCGPESWLLPSIVFDLLSNIDCITLVLLLSWVYQIPCFTCRCFLTEKQKKINPKQHDLSVHQPLRVILLYRIVDSAQVKNVLTYTGNKQLLCLAYHSEVNPDHTV